MKSDYLKLFVNLREKLTEERTALQRRLAEIEDALGSAPIPATGPMPAAFSVPARRGRHKGGMSAEGRARISAAAKARWAKIRGKRRDGTAVAAPKKKKFTMSAAARKAISEAAKKRWAARKAAAGK